MGMDLIRLQPEGYFRFSNSGWHKVLELASEYGWKHPGTRPRNGDDMTGIYFGNDGQLVSADDASDLADALKRALADMPADSEQHSPLPYSRPANFAEAVDRAIEEVHLLGEMSTGSSTAELDGLGKSGVQVVVDAQHLSPREYFSGYRAKLADFITFCREGSFEIW